MWGRLAVGVAVLVLAGFLINIRFVGEENNTGDLKHRLSMDTTSLQLLSPAFENAGTIPSTFTCDLSGQAGGEPTNPPLQILGVPTGVKSLVLIMEDPDVPKEVKPDGIFDHWVLFNIPPETKEILSGSTTAGTAGVNGAGKSEYIGPCPPKEYEPSEHRYFFKLYALDVELQLPSGASKKEVEKAMGGHVIMETQLVGRYKRE